MATPASPAKPDGTKTRSALIKLIHVGRRHLQMSDDAWRAYLQGTFNVQSSTQLSVPRLQTALRHLRRCGFKSDRAASEWSWVDAAAPIRQPLLRKIIMLMQGSGVAPGAQVAYVEGIAHQMAGLAGSPETIKPLRACDEADLLRIVQALIIHRARQARKEPAAGAAVAAVAADG